MGGLSKSDIMKVVNRYIGVNGGYLGDFSYRTHAEFYAEYCDLDIDPYQYEGTTRERFIAILSGAEPTVQARILRGVLDRFSINEGPETRTEALRADILAVIDRLEGLALVENPSPRITSAVVERAINDAEQLLTTSGATSGVDRIHTALHGYLLAVCRQSRIIFPTDAGLPLLFKLVRENHPALQGLGARDQDITQILKTCSAIMNALNPVRNQASVAHPNDNLLHSDEAMLVINIARTLLHYLDAKLAQSPLATT